MPPTSKILPFRWAQRVAKYTSAGQCTGHTIGELLLLKKGHRPKSRRATSDTLPPKKMFLKLRLWLYKAS